MLGNFPSFAHLKMSNRSGSARKPSGINQDSFVDVCRSDAVTGCAMTLIQIHDEMNSKAEAMMLGFCIICSTC